MFDLKNRIAVITGAGSGIGACAAQTFFQQSAHVNLLGQSMEALQNTAMKMQSDKERVHSYACDVRDEDALIRVRDEIIASQKRIDILVTCAAAPAAAGKTETLNFSDWKKILDTDLDGVFLTCKTFGSAMIKNGYGRIVNMTSFHTIATYPERAAYNAAKGGVQGLTRALAVEWGKYGITVNAVAPGPILTPRTQWFLSQSDEAEVGMIGRTPTGRIGEPSDVAALITFLVSEEARHINGQQIVIDGGWTKSAWWGKYPKAK